MIKLPLDKMVLTVSVTGGQVSKALTPASPESPEEIAKAAYDCYNEGAAIVHIHAKDTRGKPTGDPAVFAEIHRLIREKCDIIIQDSTGGGFNLTLEQRLACLDANPEMASLNMGTLLRTSGPAKGDLFSNTPWDIESWASRMKEMGIKPEMEVYAHPMFRDVENVIAKGLVKKPYYVNLVLGMRFQGAVDATPKYLNSMLEFVPDDAIVNVSAVAAAQLPLTTMAMVLGTCVRVGLEDNIYYRKGELATSNAQLAARTTRIAREFGREPATPAEARQILGLKSLRD